VASRFDEAGLGTARARAVLLLLYALRGTPFLYQGQELGLPDAVVLPERVVDVDGRDPERAPIPWERPSQAGPGAGFTTGEPWLPLVGEAEDLCVQAQETDALSSLHLTRRIAALRRGIPALQHGSQRTLPAAPGVLAWLRETDGDRYLVVVSFATEAVPAGLPAGRPAGLATDLPADLPDVGRLLLRTSPSRAGGGVGSGLTLGLHDLRDLRLAPGEGLLFQL
jgi:alpha-glucosidase